MKRSHFAALASLILLIASGCASAPSPAGSVARNDRVPVLVENSSGLHSVVYVQAGGTRLRLGEVQAWTNQLLWIPAALATGDNVRLATRQIAGDTFESGPIPLGMGLIVFRIRDHLPNSDVLLR